MTRIICKTKSQVVSIHGFITELAEQYLNKNGIVVVGNRISYSLTYPAFLVDEFPRQDDKPYEEVYITKKEGAYCTPDGRTTFSHSVLKDWIMDKVSKGIVWREAQYELNLDGSVLRL